jgi:hypothetical protein
MAKTCPSCGYSPIGPFIDNCPICAEPVRNVRSDTARGVARPAVSLNLPPFLWGILGGLVAVVLCVAACCGFGLWWLVPAGKDFKVVDHPKPKLLRAETIDLGHFEVISGVLAICDPGYDRGLVERGAIATKVGNVGTGKWLGRVVLHVIDTPDHKRCGELLAFPASSPVPKAPAWQQVHHDIGVDSGQAGFFDWRHFRSRAVVPADHPWNGKMLDPKDPWYSLCGDVTLHGNRAGVIPYGVVSSSGWGDGGYPAYAIRDEQGVVVGLRLVFVALDEYEPEKQSEVAPEPGEGKGDR